MLINSGICHIINTIRILYKHNVENNACLSNSKLQEKSKYQPNDNKTFYLQQLLKSKKILGCSFFWFPNSMLIISSMPPTFVRSYCYYINISVDTLPFHHTALFTPLLKQNTNFLCILYDKLFM